MRDRWPARTMSRMRNLITVLGAVISAAALVDTVHAAVPSTNVFPIGHSGAACTNSYGDPRGGGRSHAGVDCFSPANTGTPLVAVESGVIDRRYTQDPSNPCGRGNAVAIRGNSGTRYYYGHLNRIDVAMDQRVTRGQRIGTLGQTGNANPACGGGGPHLHFELRPDGTNTVDPYPYVTRWPKVGGGTPGDSYQPVGRFDRRVGAGRRTDRPLWLDVRRGHPDQVEPRPRLRHGLERRCASCTSSTPTPVGPTSARRIRGSGTTTAGKS